ncbi:DoxX family protein [Aquimarina sp. Aq78]|uniref:DoxX family protein n=1 Tax=Aquimarina sp. Aq78 TaxID=1191889 RepID=UPI000D0E880C|nr:DoxX family protein [Aquimarina sp. Aq78]
MKKRDLIIYRVVTGLFSLMLLAGAITYFLQYEMVNKMFISLGVPTEIIYPLAIVKILGILAIWLIKNPIIKTLAYLGFALDLVFAIIAHLNAGDGRAIGPAIPLVLLIISYVFYRKKGQVLN